jgi:CRISPR system Cascade subunit CasC
MDGGKPSKKALDDLVKVVIKETKDRTGAPDIALFGRMLADKPELNIDAACQVAHAISTHRVTMEMDYYTAVDDLLQDEEAGAGMVGFTGYNSACFYRYVRIDWRQLVQNLAGDVALARRTVEGFLRAAQAAVPSGKQNAFAAQNPPSLSLAVVREDGMAWSLANAFESPVRADRENGYLAGSLRSLDDYWARLERVYGGEGVVPVALLLEDTVELPNLAEAVRPTLGAWIDGVLQALPQE